MALERVRSRNEARVARDITSSIVSSAELRYIRGALNLQHLAKEVDVEWSKSTSLASPRPNPNLCGWIDVIRVHRR